MMAEAVKTVRYSPPLRITGVNERCPFGLFEESRFHLV
jgi:hypothetical protein